MRTMRGAGGGGHGGAVVTAYPTPPSQPTAVVRKQLPPEPPPAAGEGSANFETSRPELAPRPDLAPRPELAPRPSVSPRPDAARPELAPRPEIVPRPKPAPRTMDRSAAQISGTESRQHPSTWTDPWAPPPPPHGSLSSWGGVRSSESADNASNECSVCFERATDCVLYTCGHVCMCYECAVDLKDKPNPTCPICRQPIKDIIKIYRS